MNIALVAEDDPVTLRLLSMLLKQMGCSVVEAVDGRAALTEFEAQRPALVLTDLSMPRMDGLELATRIRQQDETVPIVILTGRDDSESARQARAIGVDEYLRKPVNLAELKRAVQSLIPASESASTRRAELAQESGDI